jgi:mannose-6-phosphate isomerase-like protein (cupin superfamily)
VGETRGVKPLICPTAKAEYFFGWDWTGQITLNRLNKSAFSSSRIAGVLTDGQRDWVSHGIGGGLCRSPNKHDDTDDFFLVLKGTLDIQLRDRTVTLGPGQIYVVPKGVEHRPVAKDEVHLLLIEPTGTPNTGDAKTAAPRKTA